MPHSTGQEESAKAKRSASILILFKGIHMLKRLIAITAIFSLVTVSAAVPQQNLARAIQEFNFAVTVEWNQIDSKFYNKSVAKFRQEIKDLSAQGMSNEAIIAGVLKNLKNETIAADIKSLLAVVDSEKMNQDEALNFVVDQVRTTSVTGASFNGRRRKLVMAGLLVGLAIALILVFCNDDDEDDTVIIEEEEDCYEWYSSPEPTVEEYCYYDQSPV